MTDMHEGDVPSNSEQSEAPMSFTSCDVVHFYNGDELCGSGCTLQSPHSPADHVCGNGHSYKS